MEARERASQRFFDGWSRTYDNKRIAPWFQYTQDLAIANLRLEPDSRALDVGCGTGYATRRLASLLERGRACGIDISPGMVEAARAQVPEALRPRIEFRQASSADLPYDDGAFSHLICTNSFHHYPDPDGVLAEFQRVLEPGGQLVIMENAPDLSIYTWAWDRLLRLIESGHVRYYPSHEFGQLIRSAGYEDVELRILRNEILKHGKLFASIQLWSGMKPARSAAATGLPA